MTSTHVGTGVEKNNRTLREVLDVLLHSGEVEADSLGVKVAVLVSLEASTLGNGVVVAPGRRGNVDVLVRVVLSEELHADAEGTGTRKRLSDSELFALVFLLGRLIGH